MQVSPNYTLTIGGKKYALDSSFSTLRAIQQFFDKDIVRILVEIMDMPFDKISDLIAIGAGGKAEDIGGEILEDVGVLTKEYAVLKTELLAWLNVAITPKAGREKKSAEMHAMIEKLRSRGLITNASPSDVSAGSPASSGAVTSGN